MEAEALKQFPDGIYFQMPDEVYFAQKRLSSSGIQSLMVSAATFWADSWMNPDNDPDEDNIETTSASTIFTRNIGKAYHCARLEPWAFNERFVMEPDFSQVKGMLTNGTEVGNKLKEYGEAMKKSGEKVGDQAERLLSLGYTGKILHVEKALWEETVNGRTAIPQKSWERIERDMARIKANPEIEAKMRGGEPEVVIMWTCPETEVKMKCKLDYLTPAFFTDFKSFANMMRKVLNNHIRDSIQYNRYYVQAALYFQSTEIVRTTDLPIVNFNDGNGEQPLTLGQSELIDKIRASKDPLDCWYVFQEKKGIPNILARRILMHNSGGHLADGMSAEKAHSLAKQHKMFSAVYLKACTEISQMKAFYKRNLEVYGEDPWYTPDAVADIGDIDFNPYWLEGRR